MTAKYAAGQKVRIVALIGGDAHPDPRIQRYINKTGTVLKSYCITRDEMPDLCKMFVYTDVYCCDVELEGGGTIVRGIPEVALEPNILGA